MYKVIHPFNIFEYNNKTRGHKLKRFNPGDMITETLKRRLHHPERYL